VIPIVYGEPGPLLDEQEKRGEVVLGGCIVAEGNPLWHCKACEHDFGRFGDGPGLFGSNRTKGLGCALGLAALVAVVASGAWFWLAIAR
jgi:hypothetical protein